ncbi:hypothetical protein AB4179_11270 [Vibrio lentus]|uniref:hypothetical protein n=1 Tax=Vibrio lentus TaxID=136468 RepID=UPI0024794444|nr:hypothetical protein [Vibrio lentus]WGS60199.1 hypothetical protein ISX51_13050 [Vibrio lentus]
MNMLLKIYSAFTYCVMSVITLVINNLKYIVPTLCFIAICYLSSYGLIAAMVGFFFQAKAIVRIANEKIVLDDPKHTSTSLFHSQYWKRFCDTGKLLAKFSTFYLLVFAVQEFDWIDTIIEKRYSNLTNLEYLWICLLSGLNAVLVNVILFMGWVTLSPIKLVLTRSELLMLEWYPLMNRWNRSPDITLHLEDPYKPIKSKNKQLIKEMIMFTDALHDSGFHSLSINTHVISPRLWELLKISLNGAVVVDVNKKHKNWLDIKVYKFAIYINQCGLKGKSYREYRDLMANQKFENNHIVKIHYDGKPKKLQRRRKSHRNEKRVLNKIT